MPLSDQAAWSHLEDEWLSQPSTLSNFDWKDGLQRVEDTATLHWFSTTWGKESDRSGLMATPQLPPSFASYSAVRNLRTISIPPFLDHSEPRTENLLVFPDYDDIWRDMNLWITERRMRFVPSDQSDDETAPKLDRPTPAKPEHEYLPPMSIRKVLLCLGAAGIGKSTSLRYILVRRTFQGLPTVFCGPAGSWYICCDGVFKLPTDLEYLDAPFRGTGDRRVVLADCDSQNPEPPLCWMASAIPIIQASRPTRNHVHWTTELNLGLAAQWWYRPPCVWHAVAAVALKFKANQAFQTNDFLDRLHLLYARWGPSITQLASTVYPASEACDHARRRDAVELALNAQDLGTLAQWDRLFTRGPSIDRLILGHDIVNTAVLLTCGSTRGTPIAATMSPTVRRILSKHFGTPALEWRSCLGDRENSVPSENDDSTSLLSPLSDPRSLSS